MPRPRAVAWRGPALVGGLVGLCWAIGPLVVAFVLLAAAVPRAREQLQERLRRPSPRATLMAAAALSVLVGFVVVVPDGVLPIPPGAGHFLTPGYVGRPAIAQPISLAVPQNPSLAPNGSGATHNDTWSTDAYDVPGPLGESPQVDTGWSGLTHCAQLALDTERRFVGRCWTARGQILQVIDPESMRPLASLDLPDSCAVLMYLDDRGRAVVGAARNVLIVETADGRGAPDLTVEATYDLSDVVPAGDCLVGLLPDWTGRTWWASQSGLVGFIEPESDADPDSARIRSLDLGEAITQSMSIDRAGGVYVVTDRALNRIAVDAAQRPEVTWRTIYDNGTGVKSGQESRGSGTTPTLLPGGLVAIADNAEPRMHVQFYRADTGELVCQASVFEEGASATGSSLTAVAASGVVVQNSAGDDGRRSSALGFAPTGGFARVDVVDGECEVAWTGDEAAPISVSKVSLVTGLIYATTKRPSLWGVNAWYLTAIDARTGSRIWSVRLGIGLMFDPHGSVVTLGPEGAAYVGTLAGLVRVRDRKFG